MNSITEEVTNFLVNEYKPIRSKLSFRCQYFIDGLYLRLKDKELTDLQKIAMYNTIKDIREEIKSA